MALQPVGSGASIAISKGTNTAGSYLAHQSDRVRFSAEGASCHIAVGNTHTATTSNLYLASGDTVTISCGRPSSQRVVGITTSGTTTIIDFPEGTGCPFYVGQVVSLSVTGGDQSYYDFSNKTIASINNTSGVDGYFNTRLIVNNDYGVGSGLTAFEGNNSTAVPYAELRDDIIVGNYGSIGSGALHFQQVQTTGGASE